MYHNICLNCNKNYSTYDNRSKFCSLSCSNVVKNQNNRNKNIEKYNLNPKLCKQCNTVISYDNKENIFCSHNCSATFNNSKRSRSKKTKIINSNINKLFNQSKKRKEKLKKNYINNCIICNLEFNTNSKNHKNKTCSKECYYNLLSMLAKNNPNCGGSTKQFIEYKGVSLDSSWELKVAKSLDHNSIEWSRPKSYKLSDGRRYTPDFYLPQYNVFLDPKAKRKGYDEQVLKIQQFEKEYNCKCYVLNNNQLSWNKILKLIQENIQIQHFQKAFETLHTYHQ